MSEFDEVKSEKCYVCRRKSYCCQKVKPFKNKTLCQICFNNIGNIIPPKMMTELFERKMK